MNFLLRTERLLASLSGIFGGLATLLAIIGLYGVMAYVAMRRTREIGIRIALGTLRSSVIAMIMREIFVLIGAGLLGDFCWLWPPPIWSAATSLDWARAIR